MVNQTKPIQVLFLIKKNECLYAEGSTSYEFLHSYDSHAAFNPISGIPDPIYTV